MEAGVLAARRNTSIASRITGVAKSKMGSTFRAFALGHFLFQPFDALAHLPQPLEPRQHGHELIARKGLFQEIHRTPPHGLHGGFRCSLAP